MPILPTFILPKNILTALRRPANHIEASPLLLEVAQGDAEAVFRRLETSERGLSEEEAGRRLEQHGPNVVTQEQRLPAAADPGPGLRQSAGDPVAAAGDRLALMTTGDRRLPGGDCHADHGCCWAWRCGSSRNARADDAAAKLKAMISVTATVVRDGQPRELPLGQLVPGDVVRLAAGDMIPADLRIVACKDLFVIQSSLTGESLPVEKFDAKEDRAVPKRCWN